MRCLKIQVKMRGMGWEKYVKFLKNERGGHFKVCYREVRPIRTTNKEKYAYVNLF